MAERSKAADCKSVSNTRVGSNPTLLSIFTLDAQPQTINKSTNIFTYRLYTKTLNQPLPQTIILRILPSANKLNRTYLAGRLLLYIRMILVGQKLTMNYFFLKTSKPFHSKNYVLMLNFKRLRFFPLIRTTKNVIFTSLSLGLLAKFFQKGKFFLKSKIAYLVTAVFLRKILLFSNFSNLILLINKKPRYFNEILNSLSTSSIATYVHPFQNTTVNEVSDTSRFIFPYIVFTHNKPYGRVKTKQRGRLKRKISKKIVQINKILD